MDLHLKVANRAVRNLFTGLVSMLTLFFVTRMSVIAKYSSLNMVVFIEMRTSGEVL